VFIGHRKFPRSRQTNSWSCGSRCVYAILKWADFLKPHALLAEELGTDEAGTRVEPIVKALRARTLMVEVCTKTTTFKLTRHLARGGVAILHVDGDHYLVVHGRSKKRWRVMDPAGKPDTISTEKLVKRWGGRWAVLVRKRNE